MALAKATAPRASWRSLGRVISPMPSRSSFFGRRRRQLVRLGVVQLVLVPVDRAELRDLLGQRHPFEQIGDPLVDRTASGSR